MVEGRPSTIRSRLHTGLERRTMQHIDLDSLSPNDLRDLIQRAEHKLAATPSDPPAVLYHHTDAAGLLGIIEHGTLRYSDIRFLNDSREFKQTCDLLVWHARKHAAFHREDYIKRGAMPSQFDSMMDNMVAKLDHKRIYRALASIKGKELYTPASTEPIFAIPFVASFTRKRDALSQWRGYGNAQYCIGFDVSALTADAQSSLIRVSYHPDEHALPRLDHRFTSFFEGHREHIKDNGYLDGEVVQDGLDDILYDLWRGNFFLERKHWGFHEEAEYRLIANVDEKSKDIQIKASRGYPKPYVDRLPFGDAQTLRSSITEIICGPGLDLERCETFINKASQLQDGPTLKVVSSQVPFRRD